MSKVDLTLGESKTKDDLTLETKSQSALTIDDATWSIDDGGAVPLDYPRGTLTKESKTKVDLTLESK